MPPQSLQLYIFQRRPREFFFVLFAFRWFSIILQGLIIVVWRDETIVEAWAKKKWVKTKFFTSGLPMFL